MGSPALQSLQGHLRPGAQTWAAWHMTCPGLVLVRGQDQGQVLVQGQKQPQAPVFQELAPCWA
jgi:hypothetical protein